MVTNCDSRHINVTIHNNIIPRTTNQRQMYMTSILIQKKKKQNQEHLSKKMTVRNREPLTSQRTRRSRRVRRECCERHESPNDYRKTQTISSNLIVQHVCEQKIVRDITDRRMFDQPTHYRKLHHCVYTGSTCHTIRSFTNLFLLVGSPSGVVGYNPIGTHTWHLRFSRRSSVFFALLFSREKKGGKEGRKIVARIQQGVEWTKGNPGLILD